MGGKNDLRIAVVIPLYNEGERGIRTIKKIFKLTNDDVIVVDDGSSDNSWSLLKQNFSKNQRIFLLKHIINLGKGAAMKTGVEMAWSLGAEAIIFVDADGQHNPRHLKEFKKRLIDYDLVFGYRSIGEKMPGVRRWGNVVAKRIVFWLFKIKRKDLLCGFMGINKRVYQDILWETNRYGVETEIATRVAKKGLDFSEIKIDTIYFDKYKGVSMLDAIRILFRVPIWYIKK